MLLQSLRQHGMDDLEQSERIAILVPKRNIETWMHFLIDPDTDEDTDYKRQHYDKDCNPCGIVLKELQLNIRAGTLPDRSLPSLMEAAQELERICGCARATREQ